MKMQPTKTGGGNGPKWKAQMSSSMGPSYERATAVTRKKAAAAKKAKGRMGGPATGRGVAANKRPKKK